MISKQDLKEKILNGTLCSVPFRTYELGAGGKHRFCCKWMEEGLKNEHGDLLTVGNSTVQQAWNSKQINQIRQAMLNGERIDGCYPCYQEEINSGASLRQQESLAFLEFSGDLFESTVNHFIAHGAAPSPSKMDLRFSTLCNSMCRMCTPNVSTNLAKETEKIIATDQSFADIVVEYDPAYKKEVDYGSNTAYLDDLLSNIHNVDKLFFLGGETTIMKSVDNVLQYCVDENIAQNIEVQYSMNLTNTAPKAIDLLGHFKKVQLVFSIDAYGELNDYIRYPSKWSVIENNLKKLIGLPAPFWFVTSPVPQVYNVTKWHELMQFWRDVNENVPVLVAPCHLETPTYLKVNNTPNEIKNLAIDSLKKSFRIDLRHDNSIAHEKLKFMMYEIINHSDSQQDILKKYTLAQDLYRNMHLKDYVPELAEALGI